MTAPYRLAFVARCRNLYSLTIQSLTPFSGHHSQNLLLHFSVPWGPGSPPCRDSGVIVRLVTNFHKHATLRTCGSKGLWEGRHAIATQTTMEIVLQGSRGNIPHRTRTAQIMSGRRKRVESRESKWKIGYVPPLVRKSTPWPSPTPGVRSS